MKSFVFLIFITLSLSGCIAGKGDIKIDIKNRKANSKTTSASNIASASVSSVQIINHQLIISGANLSDVTGIKVDGQSLDESFSIESKTATQIIANSIKAFSFDVSKVFNLILSEANASATFPIDFSLCNSTLNGKGFDCSLQAMDKDVLSFDQAANKWKPRSINGLSYQGSWDATDPLPATTTAGDYFIVSVASAPYGVGDWIVWNGGTYDQISNSTTITSVFGRTGAIIATEGDYNLNKLLDVDLTVAPTAGKILKFDGTHWIAGDDLSGGGAGSVTTTAIVDGSVTDAKIATVSSNKITGTLTSAQIADGAIVNADINAAAAIDYSKLNIPAASIPYAKLNIANGDIPAAKISGLPAATSVLATTIVDSDSTHAPDGNAVFDALGLKLNLTGGTLSIGTISGVPTPTNSDDVANKGYTDTRDALKLAKAGDTMSGVLTLDSDLKVKGGANYVTVKGSATSTTYDLTLPANKGTSGFVLSTDGNGVTSWIDVTSAVTSLDTDDVAEGSNLYFTEARVLGTDLAGLNTGVAGPIAAADTVLGAFGKMQYQVTDLKSKGQWDKSVNDISYGAGNVEINTKLRLKDSGTNFVELKAPATVTTTYTLTFPANDGNSNQVLRTDGAGVLTWVDITDTSVLAFAKVALPTCAAGEVLKSNGTAFSCVTDNSGGGAFSGAASKAVVTGAGGALEVSATTATEVGYLVGVTSDIQTQINGKQGLDTTLTALAAYNTNGIMVQTSADTFTGRSIAGVANRTAVTNGDGVSGNPTINVSTTLLPSPVGGDAGKFLKASGADVSAWNALALADITGALGFTPINKAGDSITSGTFTLSGTAVLRVPDPVAATDVANKQYVDGFGQWSKAGNDLYRLTDKVGIGTATPNYALDVTGTTNTTKLMAGDGAFNAPSITFASNPNTGLSTNGSLRFSVNGGLQMTLSTSSLDFNAGGAGPKIQQTGGNAALPSYAFNSDGDTGMFNPNASGGSNELGFSTAGVERIRIDPTGLIGVGTTTPKSKLDVNGAIRIGVDATACSATIAGAMRFSTPNVEFCNGTSWAAFGTSGAAVASSQITDGTIVDADVNAGANITATKLGTGAVDNTEFNYLDGVTSSIQTQLNGKQATDATLTAIAAYNTNGILVQTAADTFVGRSIAGTSNRVSVTNGDGVSGNPTVNVSATLLPSPVVGDVGKYLKATAADISVWTALSSSDITTALGFTPINKAGDSLTTGTITLSGAALLRTPDPIGLTDVANKQYVDSYGQWTKSGSDIYRLSGYVGLGTSTSDRRLTIIGDGTAYGDDVWIEGTNSETTTPQINLVRSRGTSVARTPVTATDILGSVAFRGENSNDGTTFPYAGRIDGIAETDFATSINGVLAFLTTSAGTNSEKMRITSTGNVGIGTKTPAYQIDIQNETTDATVRTRSYVASANSGGTFIGSRARGTAAAPTHPLANDLVAQYLGKNAINGVSNPGMVIWSGENQSNTALGDFITFLTTPNTTTTSTEKMRITGSGNVGIGTSTPSATLHVKGSFQFNDGASSYSGWGITGPSNALPADDLDFSRAAANGIYRINHHTGISMSAHTAYGGIRFYNQGYDAVLGNPYSTTLTSPPVMVMSVTNGRVGIGSVAPDDKFVVVNGASIGRYTVAGWTHSSDLRLKHDIHSITGATEKILKLRGVNFIMNKDLTNQRQLGFIAQEVEPLFPEVVRTDKDGYKSMVYANLIAPLVEAFKDLYKKVTDTFLVTEKNSRAIASVDLKVKKLEEENAQKSSEMDRLKKENEALKNDLDKIKKHLNLK